MSAHEYEDEHAAPAAPPQPLLHHVPERRDPLAIIGLVTVLATTTFLVATAWAYWDFSDFSFDGEGGLSTIDRLRYVSEIEESLFIAPLLVGVVLASLRELLHLLQSTRSPSLARTWARTIGAIVGAVFAVGGVIAAIDVAFIRDHDEDGFGGFANTRWQNAAGRLAAAALGAVTTWIVVQGKREAAPPPPPPAGIWPYAGD